MDRVAGLRWLLRRTPWIVVAAVAAIAPASVSAAPLNGLFKGNAYGAIAYRAPPALAKILHKVAYRPLPCGGTDGATLVKTVNGFSSGPGGGLLAIGRTTSTIFTQKTDTTAQMISTTTLDDVSLFDGLVTASQIKSVSIADANAGLISTNSTGSSFTELVVNSEPVSDPAPGTQWQLAGIGRLTARKLDLTNGTSSKRIIVDMLVVDFESDNDYGMPSGSQLVVGHSQAFFGRSAGSISVGGQAYVGLTSGSLLELAGYQAISCDGTYGKTKQTNVGVFRMPGLEIGSATTTAFGGPENGGTRVRTSSTTRNGSVLGGLITFESITAVAQDTFNGSTHVRSTTGTAFSGLVINGQGYANPARNALHITVPGYGVVHVNEQVVPGATSRNRMRVNGLRLVITDATNELGLPVGAEIVVAHADAVADR